MFAAPDVKDVEAQRAAAQPAASYPMQTDPNAKTVVSTTVTTQPGAMQPGTLQMNPGQGYQMQSGQPVVQTQGQNGTDANAPEVHKSTIARVAASVHWGTLMLLVGFFSLVEMIAASQVCDIDMPNGSCNGTRGYQVALGLISLVIAALVGLMAHFGKFTHPGNQAAVSAFLFLWWLAGVIVATFFGDFQTTQQAAGYFSTWFAFVTTLLALVNTSDSIEHGMDKTLNSVRKPLFFLAIASLVTMGAAIGPCSGNCSGYAAWAIVASVVSAFIAIVLFFLPTRVERKSMRIIGYFLVIWWIFAAACLTLGGPFRVAGNGFFGSFAALIASAWFAIVLTRET